MATIFEGIRVLDFSEGMAGSLATMLLADNGAEVIKAERPSGDPYRSMPAWIMWNRGKKGIVLDLHAPEGREQARHLAEQADVIVETFHPSTHKTHGLDYDRLSERNPGLVYCSITALGAAGPDADLPMDEGVLQAKIGAYVQMQDQMKTEVPTYRVRPQGSYGAANLAVQGIAAALRVRERTGLGQRVETSLFQGYACYEYNNALRTQVTLEMAKGVDYPLTSRELRRVNIPYLATRSKDGQWIQMANMATRLFPNWMRAVGLGHIYDDPRFKSAPWAFDEPDDIFILRDMIVERMQEKTLDEWLDIFDKNDVAADRFLTTQQFLDHPITGHLGGITEIGDPVVGPTLQAGPLIRFSRTPSSIGLPAPMLGQHDREVLSGEASARAPSRKDGASGVRRPLEGILVLDFATWLAAPIGTAMIAELGARVIKIEPPTGDEFRRTSPFARTFQTKESLVVDLKTAEGREIVDALLAKADVVMHNMRGEAPERTGIDYERVRRLNPEVLYLYAGSYGSTGPGAGKAAFHPIGGAMSGGVLWQMGRDNQPPPGDVPMSHQEIVDYGLNLLLANEGSPDVTSAIAVATALTMALYEKERTGKGQYLETSMLISNAYMCSDDFLSYAGKPGRHAPDRRLRGLHALYRLYQTASGWVFVSCASQAEWEGLCRGIAREELLEDWRFANRELRAKSDHALTAALALAFKRRTAAEWESSLRPQGIACVQADRQSFDEFFLMDPGLEENGFREWVEHPTVGGMFRHGPPVRFSRTPARVGPCHVMGEDTPAILAELGYAPDRIEDMRRRGVAAWPEGAGVTNR